MLRFSIISQGHLVKPIQDGLEANGCSVRLQPDFNHWDFVDSDYLLLHGPAKPIGILIRRLGSLPEIPPVIVWYSEQVPDPALPAWLVRLLCRLRYSAENWYDQGLVDASREVRAPGLDRWRRVGELLALQSLGCLRLVCAFSLTHREFLINLGLPAVALPFGSHPDFGVNLSLPRDVEVLFLGSSGDVRRRKIFPAITQQFERLGIDFRIVDGSLERGSAYGEDRTHLLNRTRIFLNIMKQPWDDPIFRLLLAAANGAMLLSEPVRETSRWKYSPGVHFIASEIDQLAEAAARYLQDEAARLAIIKNTESDIIQGASMAEMAGRLIEILTQPAGTSG